MPWPLSQEYNEVIQSPSSCFADPELRQTEAKCNAIGIPMPCSGNFADVYEMHGPGGKKWAVKCFTRQVAGLRERYAAISAHLKQVNLPFMVDFTYLEQGIQVKGQWYPILKMDWVEGFALNQFVRQNADNPTLLQATADIWLKVARRLREARMAHCDLQHGNVLLVPGRREGALGVRLIDYDGMFVPALANSRSGEVGHPAYQHPQRLRDGTYHAEVDRFSHLVITTALCGLTRGGRYLWNRYDNGDNLLFRQSDLEAPSRSPLFLELLKLNDPNVAKLTEALVQAARQPLEQAPLLDELLSDQRSVTRRRNSGVVAAPVAGDEASAAAIFAAATADRAIPLAGVPERPSSARTRNPWMWATLILAVVSTALAGAVVWLAGKVISGSRPEVASASKMETPDRTTPTTESQGPALDLGGGMKLELVRIKAGTFRMGSPDSETDTALDEKPQHEVKITRDFYLGKYLVTQEQYQHVMGQNPSFFSSKGGGKDMVARLDTSRFPVEQVSSDDALQFCMKASARSGRRVGLPTEAEWEYACRAGTTARFYRGDQPTGHDANINNQLKRTCPVGSYPANPWGLHDMIGNVWQRCADCKRTYSATPLTDPVGRDDDEGRMVRGGSWDDPVNVCRCARRWRLPSSSRYYYLGFRVAVRLD